MQCEIRKNTGTKWSIVLDTKSFWSKSIEMKGNIHLKRVKNSTNAPRVFHVEITWKRSFPRRFNFVFTSFQRGTHVVCFVNKTL